MLERRRTANASNGKKLRRRASPLAVLGFIAVLAALAALLLPREQPDLPAELGFKLLDGRATSLAELRGRPVLVVFWATSCAPCVEQVPDLIQLYRDLQPQGFELVAVAMPHDPTLQVQRFVHQYEIPYAVTVDVAGGAARAFGDVDFIPAAFLLDTVGEIVLRQTGKLDIERTRRFIEPMLARMQNTHLLIRTSRFSC